MAFDFKGETEGVSRIVQESQLYAIAYAQFRNLGALSDNSCVSVTKLRLLVSFRVLF